ncbi:MAG: AAA family ATPase [Gemmatimonadota bacterium]|jgi:DNA-binding SARP family transcriptional activator
MPVVRARVLGPLAVAIDGAPPPPELLWRKNVGLLVYLARSPRRTRSREHLVGVLWADKPDHTARHSLREAIRTVRRSIGEGGLITDGDQVTIADDAVQLDVDEFAACERDGDWHAARALIGGEFLEGFAIPDASRFEDWLTAERDEWRRRSVRALVSLAEDSLRRGRLEDARQVAHHALTLDPGSEPAARAAMRALALAGDRAGALAVSEQLVRRLDELDVTPDAATSALIERVRRERRWRLSDEVPLDTAAGAASRRAPLVGREHQVGQLIDAFESCVDAREATACIVMGDPGLGKSRIAEELLARARLAGAAVASVRAVEGDLDTPARGLHGLARGLLAAPGLAAATPEALAGVAREVPEWADRFAKIPATPAPLRRAFVDVLRTVCDEQPVVLLVDDAHWLDTESMQVLEQALRDLEHHAFLLVLATREDRQRDGIVDLRSRLGRDLPGTTVTLQPLEDAAIDELVAWAVPTYSTDERARLARRILSDSAGFPLLAVELLHAVALGMDIGAIAGAWPEPLRTLDQSLPGDLPDTIAAAIRVGFRRLSKAAQAVLIAAAVLDEPNDAARLGRASDVATEQLSNALDELEWQRWLTADVRGYSFVARVVREAIARDMVTAGQRQRILDAL